MSATLPFLTVARFSRWQLLRRMQRFRAARRVVAPPHGFKLCEKNLPLLRRLYGDDITIGEAKALFPLKVVGEGGGRRYWVIPKLVDRWLHELPTA